MLKADNFFVEKYFLTFFENHLTFYSWSFNLHELIIAKLFILGKRAVVVIKQPMIYCFISKKLR